MMEKPIRIIVFSLPAEIADKIEALAKKEQRSESELLCEMVLVYELQKSEAAWQNLFEYGGKTAKSFRIKDEEELFEFLQHKD